MDEWDELELVWDALHALSREDAAWTSNLNHFEWGSPEHRHRWWQLAKKQADRGLPSMQRLLLEVIKLRMQT